MPDDQIEAKLAAYVDGLLPPEDVADLERHLAANPGQRRVVEQMMQARKWVATLPRVRAPADFLEAIDPTLERSALFDESNVASRWSTLLSPQVLALAATVALVVTLLAAMVWLVPDRGGADPVANTPPAGTYDEQAPNPEEPGAPIGPQQPSPDDAMADRGNISPVPDAVDDQPSEADGTGGTPGEAVTPVLRLPFGLADPVILSANVPSIPRASGAVSQFLTANELPFGVQRLPAAALPEDVRDRLELAEGGSVFVYVVEEMSLEQVGALTGELTGDGEAHALTPRGFSDRPGAAMPAQPDVTQGNGEQAKIIYAEDLLSLQIQRVDDPPESVPPGMPQIGKEMRVQVAVSSDGYADFREIGLGRIDVLGKLPADLAGEIKATLARNYQIDASVEAAVATAAAPEGGRTRETVQLIYLDREPLSPGDVVQIELPDGSWLHTAVDELGMLDAGPFGQLKAGGESAVAVQARLRERAAELAPPATKPSELIRVVNLTARRAEGVDEWAQTRVPCLIVLHAPAQEGADPWAPLTDKPATQPATAPATQPATGPADVS
jgi:protein involved in polysaccharide export with SLBB domain